MKRFLFAALVAFPLSAYATDARITYTDPSGNVVHAGLASPICGTDDAGNPLICESNTGGPVKYTGLSGNTQTLGMVVPVCSTDANGIPQICDFSGNSGIDLTVYMTRAEATAEYAKLSDLSVVSSALDNYLTIASATNTYATQATLANYLTTSDAAKTYATLVGLNTETGDRILADNALMPKAGGTFTGTIKAPTTAATDNSTNIATTAFVYNLLSSVDYSVTGDISKSGSTLTMQIGGVINAVFAYTGTGSASMTFSAVSGSISPVDIRRNSIWGGAGVETFTLDGGTLTTTGTVADDTIYTASNDSSAYFIRVAGNVYFMTVWASGNGARAFIGLHRMI